MLLKMKNPGTYNTYTTLNRCMLGENLFASEVFVLVDSRVPVKCEVASKQSQAMLINRYRYPGFNQNKLNNADLVMHAKMLGKTYKTKASKPAKGNLTVKQQDTMKTVQIKKILVPTDFSETGLLALEHAAFMASLFKAQLYLLHVVETFEYVYNVYEPEVMI